MQKGKGKGVEGVGRGEQGHEPWLEIVTDADALIAREPIAVDQPLVARSVPHFEPPNRFRS